MDFSLIQGQIFPGLLVTPATFKTASRCYITDDSVRVKIRWEPSILMLIYFILIYFIYMVWQHAVNMQSFNPWQNFLDHGI